MKVKDNKNIIIVISSPSGAGKTSVCQKLIERNNNICLSISDTTRQARANEINGIDYNFIELSEFRQTHMLNMPMFLVTFMVLKKKIL